MSDRDSVPWRAIVESSPFSTVVYDAAGRPLLANEAFRALWGAGLESVPPGYTVLEDAQLARAGVLDDIRRAFAGETVTTPLIRYEMARTAVSGDGETRWTQGHFYPVRDGAGRVTHVVLTHIDLTERVRAEEALRASERRFGAIVHQASAGIAQVDLEGRFLLANDRYCTLVGRDRETLLGLRMQDITHPDDLPSNLELFARTLSAGEPFTIEKRYVRPDGTEVWVSNSVTAVLDDGGTPTGVVAVSVDVTDRRRAEDAERAARAEAEGASRAKSEFLAKMSHELRTPLNAIGGYAELIEVGVHGAVAPEQRGALQRIRLNQRHLLNLINDILDFSRVEAGTLRLDIEAVDAGAVVEAVEPLIAPQMGARGIVFETAGPPEPLAVLGDRERIVQICLNLLSNALKATAPGGRVSLAWTEADAERVAFRVADTGIGIAADQLEAIFNPFTQVGRALSNPREGVGLGLAISRELARAMAGELVAESTPGAGSVFTLTLPRAR